MLLNQCLNNIFGFKTQIWKILIFKFLNLKYAMFIYRFAVLSVLTTSPRRPCPLPFPLRPSPITRQGWPRRSPLNSRKHLPKAPSQVHSMPKLASRRRRAVSTLQRPPPALTLPTPNPPGPTVPPPARPFLFTFRLRRSAGLWVTSHCIAAMILVSVMIPHHNRKLIIPMMIPFRVRLNYQLGKFYVKNFIFYILALL